MNVFFLAFCKSGDAFESIVLLDCKGGFVVVVVVVVEDDDDVVKLTLLLVGLVRKDVSGVLSEGSMSSRASFSMSTSNPFILPLYSLLVPLLRSSFKLAIDDVFDELFDSTL